MSSTDQPTITLVITDRGPEQPADMRLITALTLREAREYLGQAIIELDQKIWTEKHGVRMASTLPASAF